MGGGQAAERNRRQKSNDTGEALREGGWTCLRTDAYLVLGHLKHAIGG